MLNANYASLKAAQSKFTDSAESVTAMATESSSSNRDTMIPLTSSLLDYKSALERYFYYYGEQ